MAEEEDESEMAYIYCDACGIGFHSNVYSCPECGRLTHRSRGHVHLRRAHARAAVSQEEVEAEVRDAIYGWRSGTVELRDPVTAAH